MCFKVIDVTILHFLITASNLLATLSTRCKGFENVLITYIFECFLTMQIENSTKDINR